MHALSPVTPSDVPAIVTAAPFRLAPAGRNTLWVMVAIGVVAMAFGLKSDPQLSWMSFHINTIYWLLIAAASTCFTAVFHICNAQWSRPIRRLFEAGSPFLLYSVAPLVVLYLFGYRYLFSWAEHPVEGKELWLTPNFLYIRDILALLLLAVIARKVVFLSLRRDIAAIRGGLTGVSAADTERWKHSRYDRYVAGSTDARANIEQAHDLMGRLSPAVVIIYSVVMSLIAFDQLMSVDPHWYSTLFGAFVFMSAVYLAMAWTSMGVGVARALHPLFLAKVHRSTLHDLGKLLFGFGIFWAYLFWSHYLPIWYGNIPEETGWVIVRLREQPWHDFSWMIFGACFIVPFLLGLSRDVKQIPLLLFATGAIVAAGLWLQQYLLFVPTLYPKEIPLRVTDLGITLGFMGAYLLSAAAFLERVPLMPFGDFYRREISEPAV